MIAKIKTESDRLKAIDTLRACVIPCTMTLEEGIVKARSLSQNAALFAVAYPPLMKHMGLRGAQEKDELHEYFCGEFFGWKTYKIMNKIKMKPIRTTTRNEQGKKEKISTAVMCDFYAFVQQKAAQQGVIIPDPDPEYFSKER